MADEIDINPREMNTFIAKGSEFVGKLTFEGTVRVDGKVEGEVFSKGTLVIGPGADIKAKINVDSVVISGNVNGNITAKKRIELRAPARLHGNVMTPALVVENGVIFEGNCKMENLNQVAAPNQGGPAAAGPAPQRPAPKAPDGKPPVDD